jgi:hypothetical protein
VGAVTIASAPPTSVGTVNDTWRLAVRRTKSWRAARRRWHNSLAMNQKSRESIRARTSRHQSRGPSRSAVPI